MDGTTTRAAIRGLDAGVLAEGNRWVDAAVGNPSERTSVCRPWVLQTSRAGFGQLRSSGDCPRSEDPRLEADRWKAIYCYRSISHKLAAGNGHRFLREKLSPLGDRGIAIRTEVRYTGCDPSERPEGTNPLGGTRFKGSAMADRTRIGPQGFSPGAW
jgi:hypothetical protein